MYWAVLAASNIDTSTVSLDSTSVRVHQHAQACSVDAVGRSPGGRTTKLHALVANDRAILAYRLTAGQYADICSAEALARRAGNAERLLADRAYDADAFVDALRERGIDAVIPSRRNRRVARSFDQAVYARRNEVERCFAHLKQFRRIATRYDKRRACFAGGLMLVATHYQLKTA